MKFDLQGKRIWVAGHRGLVGSALVKKMGNLDIDLVTANRNEVDLRDQRATNEFLSDNKINAAIIAAGIVGGIKANAEQPARFLFDNLAMATNIIHGAHVAGLEKLLFLGSSCMYPRLASQPVNEESLLTGALETTNEWYAIAKIAGLKLCQAYRQENGRDFIVAVPANLYGPGDNFSPESGHVVSALINRLHDAKVNNLNEVEVWGSGSPTRDFFFVHDCVDGLLHLLQYYSDKLPINLGTGREVSIRELVQTIAKIVGFQGELVFDTSKPDGMPRKILDVSRMTKTGWSSRTSLVDGLTATYEWYLDNIVDSETIARQNR
jgi:GDP-L-fucose synthase